MDLGINATPTFTTDATDRNRTSPFAFTGNKFEFRMLGSNQSIAGPNIALNTIVAEVLREYADALEGSDNFEADCREFLKGRLEAHKRVIFNGNNYTDEWVEEAERRGLPNLRTTPEAFAEYCMPKNVEVMSKNNIYTDEEMKARQEIHLEEYSKTINIEAKTMLSMARHEILPAVMDCEKDLTTVLSQKAAVGIETKDSVEAVMVEKIAALAKDLLAETDALDVVTEKAAAIEDAQEQANSYCADVIGAMNTLRATADELETIVGKEYWPYPIYEDLLFYV